MVIASGRRVQGDRTMTGKIQLLKQKVDLRGIPGNTSSEVGKVKKPKIGLF